MSAYTVICENVVGEPGTGYAIAYTSDLVMFLSRRAAISHGFKVRGSDDFNIGVFDKDGHFVSFDWMDKPIPDARLAEIAEAIGVPGAIHPAAPPQEKEPTP